MTVLLPIIQMKKMSHKRLSYLLEITQLVSGQAGSYGDIHMHLRRPEKH